MVSVVAAAEAPTNTLKEMGTLPQFELIGDGRMANLHEQSKVVDAFFNNFGYQHGLKSLQIGVDPDDVVDVIHDVLKAWKSERLAVLGTLQISKFNRAIKTIRTVVKAKYARRQDQISQVVQHWDSHEASQRAMLSSDRRPKTFHKIVRDLSWFQFPAALKKDIVKVFGVVCCVCLCTTYVFVVVFLSHLPSACMCVSVR